MSRGPITATPTFDGRVSENFAWSEVWHSETAVRLGIDNTPPASALPTIAATAAHLERVRRLLMAPVLVSSWYRCPKLNAALGSRPTSQHLQGAAVDFRCPGYGSPQVTWEYLRALRRDLRIDQIILEFPTRPSGGWVHVSFTDTPRFMALVIDDAGVRMA